MDAPNTPAGRLTEWVMAAVKPHLKDPTARGYNRCWDAVYEALAQILEPIGADPALVRVRLRRP
jgi:hypothetical protein